MPDARFARLKTDPRFRPIRRKDAKVAVDDRFKSVFDSEKKAKKRVDKYGRPVAANHERDNLRRFYRLDDDAVDPEAEPVVDYARGGALMESSDEEDEASAEEDGIAVTLGQHRSKPIHVLDEDEIDLNEDDDFADLDAEAARQAEADEEDEQPSVQATRRIAAVNLDWDHVRAIHLWKIFSSLLDTPAASGNSKRSHSIRGRLLSVRIYPSEFGKERMAKEEMEGPPADVFQKKPVEHDSDQEDDFDEDALRKYQLGRMRYYYAIAEFDSVKAAAHVYSELEGTELERSANVFDLSYVPDGMPFDDEPRDEATQETAATQFKGLDFVTDALRHSKVKLTWDEDDPERNRITRRALTKQEIEDADFKALIASESEESDADGRDKLRALLLGGTNEDMPEGWGSGFESKAKGDIDMEITFTPALSAKKNDGDETTLEKYQRKMKEKRQKRKEGGSGKDTKKTEALEDDFFGAVSSEEDEQPGPKGGKKKRDAADRVPRVESTTEELALLAAADNPDAETEHFDMKAVLKAEKKGRRKKKGKKGAEDEQDERQEGFAIDVADERFTALHEDHTFAIDPSNPHFKKTKSMTALLEEGSKRRKSRSKEPGAEPTFAAKQQESGRSLQSLVESVKRKSTSGDVPLGKRRKV